MDNSIFTSFKYYRFYFYITLFNRSQLDILNKKNKNYDQTYIIL